MEMTLIVAVVTIPILIAGIIFLIRLLRKALKALKRHFGSK